MKSVFKIAAVTKPRMTQRDKWLQPRRKCVQKYYDFAQKLNELSFKVPTENSTIVFVIAMPETWSKKKKQQMNNMPHQQKPDVDNLLKAVFDAIYKNDCHIWDVRVKKIWGLEASIEMHY